MMMMSLLLAVLKKYQQKPRTEWNFLQSRLVPGNVCCVCYVYDMRFAGK